MLVFVALHNKLPKMTMEPHVSSPTLALLSTSINSSYSKPYLHEAEPSSAGLEGLAAQGLRTLVQWVHSLKYISKQRNNRLHQQVSL